jgi:arylsulfatase A-like enzyme
LCFDRFAGLWEVQQGSLWLLPSLLVLCGLVGAAAAALSLGLGARRRGVRTIAAVALGLLVALFVYSISFGRHFEPWWRRLGVILLAACVSTYASSRWGTTLLELVRRRPRPSALVAAAIVVALELANRWLLVRLYPGFHLGLALSSVAVAGALGASLWTTATVGRQRGTSLAALLVLVSSAALIAPSASRLSRFDNFLWVLSEQAPVQREVLRLPTELDRPEPLAVTDGPEVSARSTLDLYGRSILLVTIDALRADHVGAYGYGRATTPFIDQLAREGARFEAAYCPTPHTSYSVTSLLTGKYIRPLLLQGAGADSETWADHLRRYGYRTAAFFPPAVFFIDKSRFASFDERNLGFEYVKREFIEGEGRVAQVESYLKGLDAHTPTFVWLHLFGPHEPYERQKGFDFGDRDIDRYDSEIARADATVREVTQLFRKARPNNLVIVTADHGEEFGDHGGRYHGSTVYEEQVHVPLVVVAPGAIEPRVVTPPVQTIDLLPTVLAGLSIPLRPTIRGRDLGPLLVGTPAASTDGFAYAETEGQSLLARNKWRLLCDRKLGACRLFDLEHDPGQRRDASQQDPDRFAKLRSELRSFNASHGRYERAGMRAEGRSWPAPLLRAMAGDTDAISEVGELLDDADVTVRRKAAEVLFRAHRAETAPALQLAVQRDEDPEVRSYAALALERLGQGAALTSELLHSDQVHWRRLAALALAEQGNARGVDELLAWWQHPEDRDYQTSLEILDALARIKAKEATGALVRSLPDVRLRPYIATALARMDAQDARGALANALNKEPYQGTRATLGKALLDLGADNELVLPLRRWLGVPDPMLSGLSIAAQAGILEHVGGPNRRDLGRLRDHANVGELVTVVVPTGGNGTGVRVLVEARNDSNVPAKVLVGSVLGGVKLDIKGHKISRRKLPEIHPENRVELEFPPKTDATLRWVDASEGMGLAPGHSTHLVVFAQPGIQVLALAAVPHQDEIASRATPGPEDESGDENP